MPRHPTTTTALLIATLALTACGPNAPKPTDQAQVRVTTDLGGQVLLNPAPSRLGDATKQLAFLQEAVPGVETRGADVVAISGQRGTWRTWVNGVRPEDPPKDAEIHGGDRIWWDRDAPESVRAVVGAFPEPFRRGLDGRRLPTRVECQKPKDPVCDTVAVALRDAGAVVGRGALQGALAPDTVRIEVGEWPVLREDDSLRRLEDGPGRSGVFARPSADGRRIALLDARGRTVRTLGPGGGLVAAVRPKDGPPTWFVTGTDAAGIDRAARSLNERALSGAFAIAISASGRTSLPVTG